MGDQSITYYSPAYRLALTLSSSAAAAFVSPFENFIKNGQKKQKIRRSGLFPGGRRPNGSYVQHNNMGLKQHKYHIPKKRLPPYTLLTAPRKPRRRLDLLTRRCEIAYSRCNLAELDKIAPDRIKNHPPQSLDLNIIENLGSYGQRDQKGEKHRRY